MDAKWHELRNKFAVDLYQALSKSSTQNIIMSPAGLKIILTTVLHGARGVTAGEIAEVLDFPEHKKYFADYQSLIPNFEKHLLTITTQIFIENTYCISPDFQSFVNEFLLSDIHSIDLKNQAKSVEEINDWVVKCSKQEINGLFPFVLVSSVIFKPHSKYKFLKSETLTMPFYVKPNLIVGAEMMILREKRFCTMKSRKLGAQIIEMPFAESKLSMVIILPKKSDGLEDIESKLGSVDLAQELSELWLSKVNLYLPKFKLEQTIEMNDILSKIGMPTAFTDKANFSGISTSQSLTISCVIHKVLFEVQEAGINICEETERRGVVDYPLLLSVRKMDYCNTVLAGGRQLSVACVSKEARGDVPDVNTSNAIKCSTPDHSFIVLMNPKFNSYGRAPLTVLTEIKCDHPFLFIVLAQKEVLFIGRLLNPSEI